jgi:hypothetical protein
MTEDTPLGAQTTPAIGMPDTKANSRTSLDFVFFLLLIALAVSTRTLYTVPVELDGDEIQKWRFVGQLRAGIPVADLLVDHHTARWGVNLPTLAFTWLTGFNWFTYYLVVICFFALLLAGAAVVIGKHSSSAKWSFVVFAALLFVDPMYMRSTSQLQPFVFVSAFVLLHMIFVIRAVGRPNQINFLLSALFIFLAYGAKETAIFFVPGTCVFVIAVLGWRKGVEALAYIGAYGLLLIAVETATFTIIKGEFTTRFSLLSHHFAEENKWTLKHFYELFQLWIGNPWYSTGLFIGAGVGSIYLFWRYFIDRVNAVPIFAALLFISFSILQTFVLKSIDPLVPASPPEGKYLADLTPFACMVIAFVLDDVLSRVAPRWRKGLALLLAAGVAGVCLLSLSVTEPWRGRYPIAAAWMWRANDTYALVADMLRAGIPLKAAPHEGPNSHGKDRKEENLLSYILSVPLTSERVGKAIFLYPDGRGRLTREQVVNGRCLSAQRLNSGTPTIVKCRRQRANASGSGS